MQIIYAGLNIQQYNEDDAFNNGSKGIMSLAIRSDTPSSTVNANGDFSPLIVDSNGLLYVNVGNTVDISGSITANAGTNLDTSALALETTVSSIKTAVELIDDAISGTEMQVDIVTIPSNLDIRDLTATDVVTVTGGIGQTDDIKVTLDSETVVLGASSDIIGQVYLTNGSANADVIDLTVHNGLAVAIVDGNGDQITSFGGGTQYTEGDTDASITGTAMMMEVAGNALQPISGSISKGVLVDPSNTYAVVDSSNSSSTPLGSNAEFLGTAVDLLNYSTIRISIFSDQNSGTDGLKVEFSNDGTNFDFITKCTYIANTGGYACYNRVARYMRVRFTNSSSSQSIFRLQTLLVPQSSEFSRQFVGETINPITTAIITKSVIVGLNSGGGGSYVPVKVNPSGALTVEASLSAGTNNIGDVDILSVPAPLSTSGGGTEATALRVTIASDSTGVISVDDNGGSLTVDGTIAATQSGTWDITNISGTVSLPTGASTSANQTTIIGHLDGVEGLLTTIDGDTGNISTKIDTLAGAVSGTEFQVDVITMPTVTIQDGAGSITVDNNGTFAVQATIASGATSIAKAEDVASADADVGVPAMAVRKATPANTSGTDGDYEMLQMSAGRLWTSTVIDTALPAGTNGIGKLTANSGVTIGAVEIAAAQTLATVTSLSQFAGNAINTGNGAAGTGTLRVTVCSDSTGVLGVTQATASSLNAQVVGAVAHDGVDSGNPIKIGGKASTTLPTAVSATGDELILT